MRSIQMLCVNRIRSKANSMNDANISKRQAFLAMYAFLESYYVRTNSDDIGGLLGELSILPDGSCADPASESDWDEAVQKAISGNVNARLQFKNT